MRQTIELPPEEPESKKLEADPAMYKTVIIGERRKVLENLLNGFMLSVSVNMENYSIYIGSDHYNMQLDYNIQHTDLCAANVQLDRNTNKLKIINMADWRNHQNYTVNNPIVASAVAERLTMDLLPVKK